MLFLGKDFREQINELTSFIDLGNVYGNSYLVSKAMEAGVYGEIIDCWLCICKRKNGKCAGVDATPPPKKKRLSLMGKGMLRVSCPREWEARQLQTVLGAGAFFYNWLIKLNLLWYFIFTAITNSSLERNLWLWNKYKIMLP